MFNISSSQILEFIPKERPIFIFGYCTISPIECTVITTHSVYDTIKITAPYGALCVYDSVFSNYKYIMECTFVVNNNQKTLTYELWGLGITYPDQIVRIPFDTTFYNYPRYYFNLKLSAKNGMTVVDSMLVLFKSDLQGNVKEFESAMNCTLFQNYPNPFNPNTTIKFNIAQTSHVSLKVYDILGREIATLVDAEKPPGIHEVQFNNDNSHTSSGVYFYELKVGEYRIMKKMSLIR